VKITDLSVRAGDLVIPAWRRMVAYLAGLTVLPGIGVLVHRTPKGTIVSARAFLKDFSGSWGIGSLGPKTIIGDGYVNGLMPSIKGKRLTPAGSEKNRPTLEVTEKKFDKSGRSWICVEVELTDDEVRINPDRPEALRIVQADHPYQSGDKQIGRTPLALLYRGKNPGLGKIHRIAYFDLQHKFSNGAHFFFV
jgi:hypothetical protein